VTGAAHRLGKAFALTLARSGYDMILHYHSSENEALQTKTEIESFSQSATLVRVDLTQPSELVKLFSQIENLDVLVNSAANIQAGKVDEIDFDDWDTSLDLNLRAPFFMAREAAKKMTNGGLIVNISDVGAQKAWSRYPAYTVGKAALESMTRILARALAPKVRVNAIAPGFVLQSDVVTAEEWERLIERVPLKRPARTEEVTSALEFLLQNQYITGQTIVVDGGYSLI